MRLTAPARIRLLSRAALLGLLPLAACAPDYSPDSYASRAVQQANKVDQGVVVGFRAVQISADGTAGAAAGAAAGGVAGTRVGGGDITSAFAGIGGGLIGGLWGTAVEKSVGTTNGFEYIVRRTNGEMVSVVQRDETPLAIGQKVLVIAGAQARIVADYTVPVDPQPATAAPTAPATPAAPAAGAAAGTPRDGGIGAGQPVPPPAPVAQENLSAPAAPEAPPAEAPATPPPADPASSPAPIPGLPPGLTLPAGVRAI